MNERPPDLKVRTLEFARRIIAGNVLSGGLSWPHPCTTQNPELRPPSAFSLSSPRAPKHAATTRQKPPKTTTGPGDHMRPACPIRGPAESLPKRNSFFGHLSRPWNHDFRTRNSNPRPQTPDPRPHTSDLGPAPPHRSLRDCHFSFASLEPRAYNSRMTTAAFHLVTERLEAGGLFNRDPAELRTLPLSGAIAGRDRAAAPGGPRALAGAETGPLSPAPGRPL